MDRSPSFNERTVSLTANSAQTIPASHGKQSSDATSTHVRQALDTHPGQTVAQPQTTAALVKFEGIKFSVNPTTKEVTVKHGKGVLKQSSPVTHIGTVPVQEHTQSVKKRNAAVTDLVNHIKTDVSTISQTTPITAEHLNGSYGIPTQIAPGIARALTDPDTAENFITTLLLKSDDPAVQAFVDTVVLNYLFEKPEERLFPYRNPGSHNLRVGAESAQPTPSHSAQVHSPQHPQVVMQEDVQPSGPQHKATVYPRDDYRSSGLHQLVLKHSEQLKDGTVLTFEVPEGVQVKLRSNELPDEIVQAVRENPSGNPYGIVHLNSEQTGEQFLLPEGTTFTTDIPARMKRDVSFTRDVLNKYLDKDQDYCGFDLTFPKISPPKTVETVKPEIAAPRSTLRQTGHLERRGPKSGLQHVECAGFSISAPRCTALYKVPEGKPVIVHADELPKAVRDNPAKFGVEQLQSRSGKILYKLPAGTQIDVPFSRSYDELTGQVGEQPGLVDLLNQTTTTQAPQRPVTFTFPEPKTTRVVSPTTQYSDPLDDGKLFPREGASGLTGITCVGIQSTRSGNSTVTYKVPDDTPILVRLEELPKSVQRNPTAYGVTKEEYNGSVLYTLPANTIIQIPFQRNATQLAQNLGTSTPSIEQLLRQTTGDDLPARHATFLFPKVASSAPVKRQVPGGRPTSTHVLPPPQAPERGSIIGRLNLQGITQPRALNDEFQKAMFKDVTATFSDKSKPTQRYVAQSEMQVPVSLLGKSAEALRQLGVSCTNRGGVMMATLPEGTAFVVSPKGTALPANPKSLADVIAYPTNATCEVRIPLKTRAQQVRQPVVPAESVQPRQESTRLSPSELKEVMSTLTSDSGNYRFCGYSEGGFPLSTTFTYTLTEDVKFGSRRLPQGTKLTVTTPGRYYDIMARTKLDNSPAALLKVTLAEQTYTATLPTERGVTGTTMPTDKEKFLATFLKNNRSTFLKTPVEEDESGYYLTVPEGGLSVDSETLTEEQQVFSGVIDHAHDFQPWLSENPIHKQRHILPEGTRIYINHEALEPDKKGNLKLKSKKLNTVRVDFSGVSYTAPQSARSLKIESETKLPPHEPVYQKRVDKGRNDKQIFRVTKSEHGFPAGALLVMKTKHSLNHISQYWEIRGCSKFKTLTVIPPEQAEAYLLKERKSESKPKSKSEGALTPWAGDFSWISMF